MFIVKILILACLSSPLSGASSHTRTLGAKPRPIHKPARSGGAGLAPVAAQQLRKYNRYKCKTTSRNSDSRKNETIRWLHIPKNGQSFILAVLAHSCDDATAAEAIKAVRGQCRDGMSIRCIVKALSLFGGIESSCPGLVRPLHIFHEAVSTFEFGHLVGLMREPRQRRISSAFQELCHQRAAAARVHDKKKGSSRIDSRKGTLCLPAPTDEEVVEAALHNMDSQLSFLTGGGSADAPTTNSTTAQATNGTTTPTPTPTPHHQLKTDLELGRRILTDHFRFVGLVEHYNASVCLFHAAVGKPWCARRQQPQTTKMPRHTAIHTSKRAIPANGEFRNIHLTKQVERWRWPDGSYNTNALDMAITAQGEAWHDPDEEIYALSVELFRASLVRHRDVAAELPNCRFMASYPLPPPYVPGA